MVVRLFGRDDSIGITLSSIDPDNPPPHVREAAADFGVSVHEFKVMYLDRPDICEASSNLYETCMSVQKRRKEDTSVCQFLMETWERRQCDKFVKKYRNSMREGLWYKYILPFMHRHWGVGSDPLNSYSHMSVYPMKVKSPSSSKNLKKRTS